MTEVKSNIIANFAGRGWATLISLAFVPLYIKFMGIEGYGLIGFFVSLQALCNSFDFGLSATMNRELARYSMQPGRAQEMRDLVRTLEIVYWAIGLAIASGLLALAPFIARTWVKIEQLDPLTVEQAVMIMALVVACQWPLNFYKGGLMGLQRQVLCNLVTVSATTLQGVGSVLILWLVSPTVQAFLLWQVAVCSLQTLLTAGLIWGSLPAYNRRPSFRLDRLRAVYRFAASISITSVVIILLAQLDKMVLSGLLPLEMFGYYVLAGTVASALTIPPAPISEALFPRYSQLAAQGKNADLRDYYHRGCQLNAGLVFPAAGVLVCFSKEVLQVWTGDEQIATAAYTVTSLLALGVTLNTMMSMLDLLQMAYGWLKPAFVIRIVALVLLGPLMVVLATRYGALGAAITWLLIYAMYVLITPHLVFRRLLRSEKWRWYIEDVGLPLGIALGVAVLWRMFVPLPMPRALALAYLAGVWATSCVCAVAVMPYFRHSIKQMSLKSIGRPALVRSR